MTRHYVAGWMYFFNWACMSIVDVTASAVPQWTSALIALVIVLTVNMISVKLFGEMEFWAALIKVIMPQWNWWAPRPVRRRTRPR